MIMLLYITEVKEFVSFKSAQFIVYGHVATVKDQLITIANTLAWVSVKKVFGEHVSECPSGSAAYVL